MPERMRCAACGKPTEGEASITVGRLTRYYCHSEPGVTCYMKASDVAVSATAKHFDLWAKGIVPARAELRFTVRCDR